ncbi:hypothetical protein [Streptomyces sp. ICC4]|uniref:hypothetical protein n=1 Tax=Streptomyces sp. ICC4 TaxID=2099584 RepID=UPI0013A70A20|nr:hypothetical protein [Streptomyces sp. ICC4]
MAEQFMTLHCAPCASCRYETWQRIVDGRLCWDDNYYCAEYGVHACDQGWGVPPPLMRERIVAAEGTVRLAVGGPDGVPLKVVRELYRLTLPQLREARAHGLDATPVEAELLRGLRSGPQV